MGLAENIDAWADRHRTWMETAVRECGHHEMYYSKTRQTCVKCPEGRSEQELLNEVYMPGGELRYFGFFGGGPASPKQKTYLRSLLTRHQGNAHAEAIRGYMNRRRVEEQGITVSDVSPAIAFLKAL